jgi:hypothetical protein
MPEIPEGMMQLDKMVDDVFKPDEHLYRRVPHDYWDDDYVNVDAIDLPDMSVNRAKYSLPQWVRLLSDEYHDWGVISFQVKDIPAEMQHLGVHIFRFRPKHVPHKHNYPHSEVQAFYSKADQPEIEEHINQEFLKKEKMDQLETLFPEELQLRWREQLRRKCRIAIKAYQNIH